MAFWLSFFSCLIVFGYFMIYGGYIWRGDINVQFAGLVLASLAGTGWLAWRGFICKDRLPRSGLEWVFVAAVLAMLVSLAASPDPRQGVARVGWLVAYILLFYFFISLNNSGLNRWGMLAGLITIVGLVLAQALAETLNWYMSWFAAAGSFTLPASQYRFTGLLSSSNVLMALANLFVPALIYTQARTHRFGVRVLSGIWMVIYFMIVPFSSSRGGWLGLLVSLAAITAFWAWQARPWQALTKWSRRKQVIALVTGLVILASFGFLGMRFIRTFASDPTHGSDPFGSSGRDVFWAAALKIWQQSPVAGAGPGRFGFAYWNIHPGVVPEFWPVHAHNIFFQALAETGLVGFIALISVLVFLGIGIWRRYQNAESPAKPWIAAFMAGLAGFLVQCLFDEFSAWIAVMLPVVFILAWIWSNSIPQNGYTQIRLAWLGLPIAGLLGLSAWSIWAYQPFNGWQSAALANDWRQAAESASLSAQRDPDFHFYQVEAGILWSWEWQFADDPSGLKRARACLQRATRLENVPSWVWADLAVLDYADHDAASAKIHIDRAILMSPDLPEYYLNRGNFSEKVGQPQTGLADYRKVLALAPEWADHPFWGTSDLRRQARAGFQAAISTNKPLSNEEQSIAQLVSRIQDGLKAGDGKPIRDEQLEKDLFQHLDEDRFYLNPSFNFFYDAMISNRAGIGIQLVPGFIKLYSNNQQSAVLGQLVELNRQQGDCFNANKLAALRQQLIYGYGLDAPPVADDCKK